MGPQRHQDALTPAMEEDEVSVALKMAKPNWTAKELAVATDKMLKVGICSIRELAQALTEGLNARFQEAGLKTFKSETVQEIKRVMTLHHRAIFLQIELEQIVAQKQQKVEQGCLQEAARLRHSEQQLRSKVSENASADDQKEALAEELVNVRAFKKAAGKADDITGALRAREREQDILAQIDALSKPGERARRQHRAWKAERMHALTQIQLAIDAEEIECARDARERATALGECLSALYAEGHVCEDEDFSSEEEFKLRQDSHKGAFVTLSGRVQGQRRTEARAEDTDGTRGQLQRFGVPREAGQILPLQHHNRRATTTPQAEFRNSLDSLNRFITRRGGDGHGVHVLADQDEGTSRATSEDGHDSKALAIDDDGERSAVLPANDGGVGLQSRESHVKKRAPCPTRSWDRVLAGPTSDPPKHCPGADSACRGPDSACRGAASSQSSLQASLALAAASHPKRTAVRFEDLDPGTAAEADKQGLHVEDLEDLDRVQDLIARLKRVSKTPQWKMLDQCDELGIAADKGMSRADLAILLREACTWQEMSMEALLTECMNRDLIVAMDQEPLDSLEKQELLQRLQSSTWERAGVPVCRLTSLEQRKRFLTGLRDLEDLGDQALFARCQAEGLHSIPGKSAAEMRAALRRNLIWDELPLPELRKECATRGLRQEDSDDRRELHDRLRASLGDADWYKLGIPVEKLGRDGAQMVFEEWCCLKDLSLHRLKVECGELYVSFTTDMPSAALFAKLKDALTLKHLPQSEFQNECLKLDVPASLEHSLGRGALTQRLLERMAITRNWEATGVPVELLEDSELAERLYNKLTEVDQMSGRDLEEWYVEECGFPWESCIPKSEIAEFCKLVIKVTDYMTLEDLKKECERHGVSAVAHGSEELSEEDQKILLADRLTENNRMEHWEKRGYQVRCMCYEDAANLVRECENCRSMSDLELKEKCQDVGISAAAGADKEERLRRLKEHMTWELIPLEDLKNECLDRCLPVEAIGPTDDEDEQRSQWIQQLNAQATKENMEERGFSLKTLSMFQVTSLAAHFERLESRSIDELREERIPLPSDLPKELMIHRLQDWMILLELPWHELGMEGQIRRIPTEGFPLPSPGSIANSSDEEDTEPFPEIELRVKLQSRIYLRKCFLAEEETKKQLLRRTYESFPARGSTASRLVVKAKELGEVWNHVRHIRDPFMAEIVCDEIVSDVHGVGDIALPAEARSWPPLEAALFALTGGIYDPRKCNPNPRGTCSSQRRSKLISVICPTSDNRRIWHPLIYESFQQQTYEPRELVIVDTGVTPSSFFQEVANNDQRVVYRFFQVQDRKDAREDAFESSRAKVSNPQSCWSLGLKRNIACSLSQGVVIAQFDDDDLYFPEYLTWFWYRLLEVAGRDDGGFDPALAKLAEWHLVDFSTMNFHYMDPRSRKCIPLRDQPATLYGRGFSYVFTRRAWEIAPFPDVCLHEDTGFVEGLLASGVPVSLLPPPKDQTLVAHTIHQMNATGGEVSVGQSGCNNRVGAPAEFAGKYRLCAEKVQKKYKSRIYSAYADGTVEHPGGEGADGPGRLRQPGGHSRGARGTV